MPALSAARQTETGVRSHATNTGPARRPAAGGRPGRTPAAPRTAWTRTGVCGVLGTISWSDIWFANIFSHSIACCFILLVGSVTELMLLILMKVKIFLSWITILIIKKKTKLFIFI